MSRITKPTVGFRTDVVTEITLASRHSCCSAVPGAVSQGRRPDRLWEQPVAAPPAFGGVTSETLAFT